MYRPLGSSPKRPAGGGEPLQRRPKGFCLLHRNCFLNPEIDMNDHFRRCMMCQKPADPDLVRLAAEARAGHKIGLRR